MTIDGCRNNIVLILQNFLDTNNRLSLPAFIDLVYLLLASKSDSVAIETLVSI